jgi:hypothetical protein
MDITGQRFGRLIALERVHLDRHGKAMWRCRCDCGGETFNADQRPALGRNQSVQGVRQRSQANAWWNHVAALP